jgi:hypothetical protein
MKPIFSILCVTSALLAGRDARAQDTPTLGITMGYPAAFGVIWNVADRLALRPEVTISKSSTESSGSDLLGPAPVLTSDATQVGVGLSALYYIGRWDAVRTYVSPRFTYSRSSASTNPGSTVLPSSTTETTGNAYATTGSFGAQGSLGRHFGVFGEIGAGFTSLSTTSNSTLQTITPGGTPIAIVRSESHTHTWSIRTGAGVIFYF